MINQDVEKFFETNWSDYLAPVTELSKNKNTGEPLVYNERMMYDFDNIVQHIPCEHCCKSSVDAIMIHRNNVFFIEFKSGFKKRITKENLKKEKATCVHKKEICDDYWKLFFSNQKKETGELIKSIRFKALESYLTFEKYILPQCDDITTKYRLIFLAVIDEDPVDTMEDILCEISKTGSSKDNCYTRLRNSLTSYINKKDFNDKQFLYDEIRVMSIDQFDQFLKS